MVDIASPKCLELTNIALVNIDFAMALLVQVGAIDEAKPSRFGEFIDLVSGWWENVAG